MAPLIAAILVGSALTTAYMGQQQAESQKKAAEKAKDKANQNAVQNQNALVKEKFNKRKEMAQGLGEGMESPMGLQASQSGAILTSVTGNAQNSILG